ncbi:MAG: hypothetical protein ABI658_14920 [Acidimicrobiales bacterium]
MPVLSLAIVLIAVAMTTASIWNTVELVRGSSLGAADQLRAVMSSLPSEPCLVAIVSLLLLHTAQLIRPQRASPVAIAALIVGRVLAAVYVIGGVAAATDVLVRKSKSNFPTTFRGPVVLSELSLAVLGAAVWLVASSDASPRAPRRRRPISNVVEIEAVTDG